MIRKKTSKSSRKSQKNEWESFLGFGVHEDEDMHAKQWQEDIKKDMEIKNKDTKTPKID